MSRRLPVSFCSALMFGGWLALGSAGTTALAATAAPAATAPADTASAPASTLAQWRELKLKFDYNGFTALYTCDGLEGKVRQILLSFGARSDLKVRATGCDYGSSRPSRFAWVTAEFSALAPAPQPAPADAVKASWVKVQLAPNRPGFMGAGECELVEQMHELLQKGFALRNTEYRTRCVPHQVSLGDYSVTTEVLKPAPAN
ncbi:MAG TPA: hypothetical protein VMT49_00680 [Steroidobacteraceae bacterium]|nr:hypothetical protein [Steroidobacteraceae bacterium]